MNVLLYVLALQDFYSFLFPISQFLAYVPNNHLPSHGFYSPSLRFRLQPLIQMQIYVCLYIKETRFIK